MDKKLIYNNNIDKITKAIVFSFPKVLAGSVIEYRYKWRTFLNNNYPDWDFQSELPNRYSEVDVHSTNVLARLFTEIRVYQPFAKDTTIFFGRRKNSIDSMVQIKARANIKAYKSEPYMAYEGENLERLELKTDKISWQRVVNGMLESKEFGEQLNADLEGQSEILYKITALTTKEEKIAWIFKMVRDSMKWDKTNRWYTKDGIQKAWAKKVGNSTEINLIVYHFLKLADIDADLMVVCPRKYGRMDPAVANVELVRKVVVFPKIDSTKYFVLDASSKYNTVNDVPYEINGLVVVRMDAEHNSYKMWRLKTGTDKDLTAIQGVISADGKLTGTIEVNSYNYSRQNFLESYGEIGEKAYIEKLERSNNRLKVHALKIENLKIDSLPLIRKFNFTFNLAEPDGQYLYFNPNAFGEYRDNPFLSETRVANVDFGSLSSHSINGQFKLPPGYKVDVLPQTMVLEMPGNSISFKRVISVQDDMLLTHYVIVYRKVVFNKTEYPALFGFFKKMYEMLNEQVILKKS